VEQPWTIRRILSWTAKDFADRGLDSPRLDAELLVAHALGLGRVALYMDLDRPLSEAERLAVREVVRRRRGHEPVAYIVGAKEFWGRTFRVSSSVLVPRPDTEALVERALELVPAEGAHRILDLCTGSGVIGLTLAAERAEVTVDLVDISPEALAVARSNAALLGLTERVRTLCDDLFDAVAEQQRYGLVTANPPYIPEPELSSLAADVRDHEPRIALVGGYDGFEIHRRLVAGAGDVLAPGGSLLVEVGKGQAPRLEAMLLDAPWVATTARLRDLGGVERVVEARRRS
jgi:release factor glutamine methyltransferase